ncbi:unnamed protein product, partial [Oppiella nova]
MDDPLSAVDTSVAEHIFDNHMRHTYQSSNQSFHQMYSGVLVGQNPDSSHTSNPIHTKSHTNTGLKPRGPVPGSQGLDFMKLLSDQDMDATKQQERDLMRTLSQNSYDTKITSRTASVVENPVMLNDDVMDGQYSGDPKIQDENRESGSISGRVYWKYIRAGAGPLLFSVTLFFTLNILTDSNQENTNSDTSAQNNGVIIYSSLMGALFMTSLLRAITWFVMFMRASVNLHNSIFYRLLRAPIAVFDNNPVGRILNRFTKDLGIIDEMLPSTAYDLNLNILTDSNQENTNSDTSAQNNGVIIYSSLMGALFMTSLLRAITWFVMFMRASVNLHNSIFYRLLRAPIAVFDNNPVGRILNRFTKDLGIIDEMLPSTAYDLNLSLTQGIGSITMVALVNPYLILPAIALIGLILLVRVIYIKSARDIKRFEGLTRSPVYSHVSTTLSGLASVRAYGAQEMFEQQYYVYQDDHSATWILSITANRSFGLIMDWLCVGYIVVIFAVLMIYSDGLKGGEAGLAFSSALMLTGMTQWGVRQSAELESQMTSVERIIEYSKLPQEAPLDSDDRHRPPPDWPSKGQIELRNMSLVYEGSTKPVLKN